MAQESRDRGCCSISFIKTALHIFNVIFLLVGLGILGVAIWTFLDQYQYVSLLTTVTYPILTYFLIAAGGLVLFVALMGCCAVCHENRPTLIFYIFLLLLIFLVEAMVGVLSYMYQENVETELKMNLNNTMLTTYEIDKDKTSAIDYLQEKFRCCGAESFSDWKYSLWQTQEIADKRAKVPDSCCKTVTLNCGWRTHPSNINYAGCMDRMAQHMKEHLDILSAVGLGICVLQIFGIVFACMLYIKLKKVSKEPENNALL